jgi:hypothetical protein
MACWPFGCPHNYCVYAIQDGMWLSRPIYFTIESGVSFLPVFLFGLFADVSLSVRIGRRDDTGV